MLPGVAGQVRPIDGDSCGLYRPGHQVHMIQARLARQGRRIPGHVTGIDGSGWITVETALGTERFWHHDAPRAQEVLEEAGGDVEVSEKGALLAHTAGGTYFLCVSKVEATPCVSPQQIMQAIRARQESAQDLEALN